MASVLGIDNSIGWAHWQLKGAWRNTLFTAGSVGIALPFIIVATLRLNPADRSSVLSFWRNGLLAVQGLILVLFATGRCAAAVRADMTTRMLESHRLMPVPPLVAITGYIWGPVAQSVALWLVILIIGAIVTLASGMSIAIWLAPNVILLGFSIFCWVVGIYGAFLTKAASGLIVGFFAFTVPSQGMTTVLLPGLALLASPLLGKGVFSGSLSTADLTLPLLGSSVAQVMIGSILFVGASRKYRRTEDTALGIIPGLLLLLTWVAVSAGAIYLWEDIRRLSFVRVPREHIIGFIASIVSAVLLALVPIANTARGHHTRWLTWPIVLLCTTIVSLLVVSAERFPLYPSSVTACAVLASLVSTTSILRIIYRVTPRAWPFGAVWIFVSWMVPFVLDYTRWAMQEAEIDFAMTYLSACSPIGALAIVWENPETSVASGILFQAACAAALMLLYYGTALRRPRKNPLDPPAGS